MPVYVYRCGICGERLEVLHGVHERGPHACPKCGGQMHKTFAPPAIHFKGSGWAKVDRRSSRTSSKSSEGSDSGSDASSTGASTATTSTGGDD